MVNLLDACMCEETTLLIVDSKTRDPYLWRKLDERLSCQQCGVKIIHGKFEPYLGTTFHAVRLEVSTRREYTRIKTQGKGGITAIFRDRSRWMFTRRPTKGSVAIDGMEASRQCRMHHVKASRCTQTRYMAPLKPVSKPASNVAVQLPSDYSNRQVDQALAILGWDMGRFPLDIPRGEAREQIISVMDFEAGTTPTDLFVAE